MKPWPAFDTYTEAAIVGIVIGLWLGLIASAMNNLVMFGNLP